MKREEEPWQQLLPLSAEDPAREYISTHRRMGYCLDI